MPGLGYRHAHSEPPRPSSPHISPTASEERAADGDSDEIRRFHPGATLGSGTFSVVKLGTHGGTGLRVALKMLSRKKISELGTEERVEREIRHLRLCAAHPHLTKLYDVVNAARSVVLAMEYISGGELYDHMNGQMLPTDEARCFFQQIVSGVEYMHHKGVVHRDLKLENILLDATRRNVKIVDFGLSNLMREGEMMVTACGSPHYAAPEVIKGKPYEGPGVDVWSAGVVLFAMLSGALPFHERDMRDQFRKIKAGIYTIPSHIPPGAQHLIQRMMTVDTKERITIPEIRQQRWFQQNLPHYLRRSPEETEKEERRIVDARAVDEVVKRYGKTGLPSGEKVTRVLVKAAATCGDAENDETLRDLRCAYELILDGEHERQHLKELTQQTGRRRFHFGLLFSRK